MNDFQLAQTLESSDGEDEDLNSKPTPEANATKNNLFMSLWSGRCKSLHGERVLIQVFATNCDHCVEALKDLEVLNKSLSDERVICIASCIRGKMDEARKFVPESSGNVRHFHAGTDTANMIRQAALTTDNIASVPFYITIHDNGTMIHISRNRNDLTVTNHHSTISKCFVSLVPHMTLQKRAENMGLLEPEPFLHPSNDRFVTHPIHHHDLWAMCKNHFASLWSPEEIDLKGDRDDFDNKLTDDKRHFIKHVLAFFAASDGIVNENLALNFSSKIQVTEARCFCHFQMAMENVHAETCLLLIDTCVAEGREKNKLLRALEHFDCIREKSRLGSPVV